MIGDKLFNYGNEIKGHMDTLKIVSGEPTTPDYSTMNHLYLLIIPKWYLIVMNFQLKLRIQMPFTIKTEEYHQLKKCRCNDQTLIKWK